MPNVDSRQYRFAFAIHSGSDAPSDFPYLSMEKDWLSAFFMPGDTDTFWQPPEYPPRIFVLEANRLLICPHPTSGEEVFEAPLGSLMAIELQKALLYGSVVVHTTTLSKKFRYSTLHQTLLDAFLRKLRSLWLSSSDSGLPVVEPRDNHQYGFEPCQYALDTELDTDELLYEQYFQPAIQISHKTWLFRRPYLTPAFLASVTNRRIMAISTGAGERNDPYEVAIRYVSAHGF